MCNNPVLRKVNGEYRPIPCGGCLGCRLDTTLLMQARCNTEFIKGRSAFVTLTYDDLHLEYNEKALLPTLHRSDLHNYLDNIKHQLKKRPFFPEGSRKDFTYFASGEYGGKLGRPHFHVLFFGLDFKDFERFFKTTWKNGNVLSLPILNGGIRYVVDYMSKNINGAMAEKEYDETKRERPFRLFSRGLGFEFFLAHKDEIQNNGFIKMGSRKIHIPNYYKQILTNFNLKSEYVYLQNRVKSYREICRRAESLGFNYDDYIKYERKNNELTYYVRNISDGVPNLPSYNELDSFKDGYSTIKNNESVNLHSLIDSIL